MRRNLPDHPQLSLLRNEWYKPQMARLRIALPFAMLVLGATLLGAALAQGEPGGAKPKIRNGGTFRITVAGETSSVDPALSATQFELVEATCARLMTYPDKPPPRGYRLVPEVASGFGVSRDGKTYTFTLRRSFRFSNGAPVRASAFSWAFTRILRLNENIDAIALLQEIVGADRVQNGTAQTVAGITARGNRLVIRLTEPAPDFPARMTAPCFCAVPPGLPADPEGVATFPAAGPYYVADNVRGRRIVLRRNRFYRGSRPHHVDSLVAEGGAGSFDDVLDRVERGTADWGFAPPPLYFDPSRRLAARYGVNKARFWVRPGLLLDHYPLNVRRPLFRNNPRLRRAVSFAIDRSAIRRVFGGPVVSRLTDQYLPPSLPGFRDARIYPLRRPNVRKARALARGHTRSGKAVLYTYDTPLTLAAAQVIKRNLAQIGLEVEVKGIPPEAYYGRIIGNPDEPWDIARMGWLPDHLDPYTYLNLLFDGRFARGGNNLPHFDVPKYNRLLRRTARLRGQARYRAYGALDVRFAREAAPSVPIDYANEPTLVSARVDRRCILLRPTLLLNAVCLK
jgi:peptide/nickel transport system substrate-binding protein